MPARSPQPLAVGGKLDQPMRARPSGAGSTVSSWGQQAFLAVLKLFSFEHGIARCWQPSCIPSPEHAAHWFVLNGMAYAAGRDATARRPLQFAQTNEAT